MNNRPMIVTYQPWKITKWNWHPSDPTIIFTFNHLWSGYPLQRRWVVKDMEVEKRLRLHVYDNVSRYTGPEFRIT